jgi:Carboxypeptidase regulatory-like domain
MNRFWRTANRASQAGNPVGLLLDPRLAVSVTLSTIVIASCWLATVANAQQTGTVTGRVLDDRGEPVSSAPVEARTVGSQRSYRVVASPTGVFSLELPAGSYDLTIPVAGFEQKHIAVVSSQTVHVDLRLVDVGISLNTAGEDLASRIAAANRPPPPSGATPRTPDGKPDFTGVWWPPTTTDAGKPEMLPAADAVFKERTANNIKDSPSARCLPDAVLRLGPFFKLIQTPKLLILFLEEEVPGYRQVFLDGRAHPKDLDPTWYGHAIGRWDGDTLVIDTVGFNDERWLSTRGQPMTSQLHLVERYRRPDLGHLEIETTVDDPGAYAKPWTVKRVADLAPSLEIQEYICENNKYFGNLVGN